MRNGKRRSCFGQQCACYLRSSEVVVETDSEYDKMVHLSYGDMRVDSMINQMSGLRRQRQTHSGKV